MIFQKGMAFRLPRQRRLYATAAFSCCRTPRRFTTNRASDTLPYAAPLFAARCRARPVRRQPLPDAVSLPSSLEAALLMPTPVASLPRHFDAHVCRYIIPCRCRYQMSLNIRHAAIRLMPPCLPFFFAAAASRLTILMPAEDMDSSTPTVTLSNEGHAIIGRYIYRRDAARCCCARRARACARFCCCVLHAAMRSVRDRPRYGAPYATRVAMSRCARCATLLCRSMRRDAIAALWFYAAVSVLIDTVYAHQARHHI